MNKYSKKAEATIEKIMHEYRDGDLIMGQSHKRVTSRKQAIAIGISKARSLNKKVPKAPRKGR